MLKMRTYPQQEVLSNMGSRMRCMGLPDQGQHLRPGSCRASGSVCRGAYVPGMLAVKLAYRKKLGNQRLRFVTTCTLTQDSGLLQPTSSAAVLSLLFYIARVWQSKVLYTGHAAAVAGCLLQGPHS